MRTIPLTLLALVFGLSACSFSLTSGPNPHAAYPGTLAAMHGPGKPARRVVRDAAPKREPSATPTFVLANRAIAPKPEPKATPTFVLANRALAPKPGPKARPKLVLPARVVEPTPRP